MLKTAALVAILLSFAAAARSQAPSSAAGDLERRAEEAFVADDLDAAIELYRRLAERLEERPEKLRILMVVASVQHLAGRDREALETLIELLVLDPDHPFDPELYDDEFRKLFYEAQKHSVNQRAIQAARRTNEGIERMRAGDAAGARESFEEALRLDPALVNAIYNLALTNLRDGRADDAQAGFERLLALAGSPSGEVPTDLQVRALINLGYLYGRRRQYGEAENVLRQATELDAGNAVAWLNLGDARRQLGQRELAAEAFRRAYELDPSDADAVSNLALAHLDARDWGRALIVLRDATREHPDRADLWLHLGRAHHGLGDGASAAAALEKALRLDSRNASGTGLAAALHLAVHYYGIGDFVRAQQEAGRVLAWDPDNVDGLVYQGLAQKGLGNLDESRRSLEEARRLDPTRAATHSNLGSVYYELGRYDEAAAAFERALEIDPGFEDARRNLEILRRAATGGQRR